MTLLRTTTEDYKIEFEKRCDEVAKETIMTIESRSMTQEQFRELLSEMLKLTWLYFERVLNNETIKST
jgi:hypothetical protein